MIELLLLALTCILIVIAVQSIINVFALPRLVPARPEQVPGVPLVSVLIPARNEADVIGETLQMLQQQTCQQFEIIVLDDNSTDATALIAARFAEHDERIRVISGQPLPPGWLGKNWACQQLASSARGDLLLFVDADTRWQPEAISALIRHQQKQKADLLTIWPTQITATWAERLIVPLMNFVVLSYLPVLMVHHSPFSLFAAANGQCMLWKADAYRALGGHRVVAAEVLEDVKMARLAKRAGYKLRMADGNTMIACRMYKNWESVRNGFAKNILAGYGGSVAALAMATVFHLALFVLPLLLILDPIWRGWGIALMLVGVLARALTAAYSQQRVQDALLMPVSVILMTLIAQQAVVWHWSGTATWKGRNIAVEKDKIWLHRQSSSAQGSAD
jgi:chlorobactene glucosyltransferase